MYQVVISATVKNGVEQADREWQRDQKQANYIPYNGQKGSSTEIPFECEGTFQFGKHPGAWWDASIHAAG